MWHFLYNSQVGLTGWISGIFSNLSGASPLADRHLALPSVALVDIWRMAPLAAFLLVPGVLAVPQDKWTPQEHFMGAPVLITWLVVVLPRLRLLVLTVLLLLVAQSLTTFDTIFVLTGGGPGTLTISALYAYSRPVIA